MPRPGSVLQLLANAFHFRRALVSTVPKSFARRPGGLHFLTGAVRAAASLWRNRWQCHANGYERPAKSWSDAVCLSTADSEHATRTGELKIQWKLNPALSEEESKALTEAPDHLFKH